MNSKFEQARENLLDACREVVDLKITPKKICSISSWGADSTRHANKISPNSINVTDHDVRQVIRSQLAEHYVITSALITRIQLIQMSCSKILNSWNGMSSDFNEFRYIVERYAILNDILNKIDKKLGKASIGKLEDLNEVSEICLNFVGTRFDWRNKLDKNFEEMKETDYKFSENVDLHNFSSRSILTSIDRINKSRINGLRPFYSLCCEFVHPNIGDHMSCMSDLEIRYAKDGSILRMRNSSNVSIPSDLNAESELWCRGYSFAEKILKDFISRVPETINLVKQSIILSTTVIHSLAKRSNVFELNDLCPCGNGRSVKNCRRLNKK